jgi:hypothetical protein
MNMSAPEFSAKIGIADKITEINHCDSGNQSRIF